MTAFDKDSNLTEYREYHPPKQKDDTNYPYSFTEIEYLGKRPLQKITGYRQTNADSSISSYILYKYGEKNYSTISYYDKDKKTLREKIINRTIDSLKSASFQDEFDGNNRLVKHSILIYDSINRTNYFYTYDSLNNILEFSKNHIVPEANGNLKTYYYQYYGSSNKKLAHKDTTSLIKNSKLYDKSYAETEVRKDGKIITRYHIGGLLKEVEDYTYNEKGEMLTYKRHAKSPSEPLPDDYPTLNLTYQYKYDQYSNWTEKEVIDATKNKPLFFAKRTITYY